MPVNRHQGKPPAVLRTSLDDAWESYVAAVTEAGLPLPETLAAVEMEDLRPVFQP